MADNAAHVGKRWRYVVKLTAFVDIQQPDPIVLSYVNWFASTKKTQVGTVAEILGGLKMVILSLYGLPCHGQNWAQLPHSLQKASRCKVW